MAQGTLTVFNEVVQTLGVEVINLNADTFKMAFISVTVAGSVSDPRWGAGGSTDLTTNEVSGTNYTAGGNTMSGAFYGRSGGTSTFDTLDPATWLQNASAPTDIKTAIIYDSSDAGKRAIALIDMTVDSGTTPISLADGDITVTLNGNGIFQLSV